MLLLNYMPLPTSWFLLVIMHSLYNVKLGYTFVKFSLKGGIIIFTVISLTCGDARRNCILYDNVNDNINNNVNDNDKLSSMETNKRLLVLNTTENS